VTPGWTVEDKTLGGNCVIVGMVLAGTVPGTAPGTAQVAQVGAAYVGAA
jgi:hypothetical protein